MAVIDNTLITAIIAAVTETTATTYFHGTSISVFQQRTKDKGEEHGQHKFREEKVKTFLNFLTPSPMFGPPSSPRRNHLLPRVL